MMKPFANMFKYKILQWALHQWRKGFLPQLFFTFCLGSGTEAYWGEAKRYIFWPRLSPEAIDLVFCLGLGKNRGIFLSLQIGSSEGVHP